MSELRITGHGFKTTPNLFPAFLAIAEEGLGASSHTHIPTVPHCGLSQGQVWGYRGGRHGPYPHRVPSLVREAN